MKRIWLFLLPLLAGINLFGQPEKEKIVTDPQLITDRVINYTWDLEKSEWVLNSTVKYTYSYENGEVQTLTTSDYNSGIPVSQMVYSYTPEKVLKETLYQNWVSGIWKSTRRDLWYSNDEGLTVEALIQLWQNDIWVNRTRFTDYQYDNRQLLQYTDQKWTNNQWVNYLYDSWYYDEKSNLTLRLQINVSTIPINKFIYTIGENNLRQTLTLYTWVSGLWVEGNRRLYEYNQCGRTTAVVYQVYKNGNWVNSTREEYFYSIDTENLQSGQRVPICHNGHTIYVSIKAVEAHLAHGDCIGECTVEKKPERQGFDELEKHEKPPFTIYPNPTKGKITIKFDKDKDSESKRVELTDFYGKLIKSFNIKDNGDLTIYRDNLLSGKYYVRLVGKEVYSAVVIFE